MAIEPIQITKAPSALPFYAKALVKGTHYQEGRPLPQLQCQWQNFQFPQDKLEAYRRCCHYPPGVSIPLLFPHSFLGPVHLLLMTHPRFPLKLMGAIHSRNHLIQYEPLFVSRHYDTTLAVISQRRRPQGLEFDLETKITHKDKLVWHSLSVYLVRMKLKEEDPESPLNQHINKLNQGKITHEFAIPKGVGKQFAMITGDINPIHMSRLLAKAFGFKRDLAHGMWSVGRVFNYFKHIDPKRPLRFDVAFKGPMYLGDKATLKEPDAPNGAFELYSGKNERPSVVGHCINVDKSQKLQ